MAADAVTLSYRADICDLVEKLKTLPGVTAAEARKMATELDKSFKAAARAADKTKGSVKGIEDGLASLARGTGFGAVAEKFANISKAAEAIGPKLSSGLLVGGGLAAAGVAAGLLAVGLAKAAIAAGDLAQETRDLVQENLALASSVEVEAINEAAAAADVMDAAFKQLTITVVADLSPALVTMAEGMTALVLQVDSTAEALAPAVRQLVAWKDEIQAIGDAFAAVSLSPLAIGLAMYREKADDATEATRELADELERGVEVGLLAALGMVDTRTEAQKLADAEKEAARQLRERADAQRAATAAAKEAADAEALLTSLANSAALALMDARQEELDWYEWKTEAVREAQKVEAEAWQDAFDDFVFMQEAERREMEKTADEAARLARDRIQWEQAIAISGINAVGALAEAVQDGQKKHSDAYRAAALVAYAANKASALGNIWINTAEAVTKANAVFGPLTPMAIAATTAAYVIGGVQAAAVLATDPPEFSIGGMVAGPSPDHRLVAAQEDEAILSRSATRQLGPEGVSRLNSGEATAAGRPVEFSFNGRALDSMMSTVLRTRGSRSRRALSSTTFSALLV